MLPHWQHTKRLLGELVSLSQHIDKNGMDLSFTCTETKFKPSNNIKAFTDEMEKPEHRPMSGEYAYQTNMAVKLGSILKQYVAQYRRQKKDTRKMTIVVLTDGIWKGMKEELSVDHRIIEFSNELESLGGNETEHDERRVSIQFVQFGSNPAVSRRLKRLDDQLKYKGVP